jgi:methionyl-tRNA formyltransferase
MTTNDHARPPRLVMLGTGDFAVPTFRLLLDRGFNVAALLTQPDRPQGRRQEVVFAAIKKLALDRGVRVEQPEDVNAPEGAALVRSLEADLLVTAAYGQILSAEVLGLARLGGINLHGSILPRYRGAAPVARAIQNGESEAGVTVIRMTPRIDAGGMMSVARTAIDPDETAGALEARLADLGAPLVAEAVEALAEGRERVIPQDGAGVTRAPKLSKDDGRIDWSRPAREVHNLVRAMVPWPIARTSWVAPDRPPTPLIVHRSAVVAETAASDLAAAPGRVLRADAVEGLVVAAGSGAVRLIEVQVPGKKVLPAADFLRGVRLQPGDQLG